MDSWLNFYNGVTAHMLEVAKLHGPQGEELPLYTKVRAQTQATRWLSQLEYTMKTTMHTVMESCVQARLDDGESREQINGFGSQE